MTMTSIVNILTGLFEAITIFMFINSYVDKRDKERPIYTYVISVLALATLINISNRLASLTLLNVLFIGLSIFLVSFVYNKQLKQNIIPTIISVLVFCISEVVVLFTITLITGITVEQATVIDSYRILGTILSKLFAFTFLKILALKHQHSPLSIKISYWLYFIIIFVTSTVAIYLLFIFQYNNENISIYNQIAVWCSFGLMYSMFFSVYLYESITKQAEIERNQELFKQQIKAQSKHLDEILITQKQVKKLRHDLINHNISIQAYFENQDYVSGLEYLKSMNQNDIFSDNMIETGNVALDAIMNTKKSIALSKGIEFETKIQIPENIFVDAIDICIIFGNALDNCIEACDKIKNGPKKISVSIIYEDESVICKIVNTTVKNNSKFLHTTKSDNKNHGFGIGNIESALEKYKNICRFKWSDTEFILSFVIFKD